MLDPGWTTYDHTVLYAVYGVLGLKQSCLCSSMVLDPTPALG
jgi:hypothetical protein